VLVVRVKARAQLPAMLDCANSWIALAHPIRDAGSRGVSTGVR
jgi:hypothetical protein